MCVLFLVNRENMLKNMFFAVIFTTFVS